MAKYPIESTKRRLRGGLRLPDGKALSRQRPLRAFTPTTLVLPIPPRARLCLDPSVDMLIEAGTPLYETLTGLTRVAPRTIRIRDIQDTPTAQASGDWCPSLHADVLDPLPLRAPSLAPLQDPTTPEQLRQRAQVTGLVGLGGGGFPAHQKWQHPVHTLIVNGAECEPFLTADEHVMRMRPDAIWRGIDALCKALTIDRCVIAVEDNKVDALEAMQAACPTGEADYAVELQLIPTRYPSGAERQLIWLTLGIELPGSVHPIHQGILVHNPATLAALADAIDGFPLTDRIITLTGPGIRHPQTLQVPIGSRISDLLTEVGGVQGDPMVVRHGGPLMGWPLHNLDAPVEAVTGCLYCDAVETKPELPCIRCGECADVCPVQLQPQQLFANMRHGHLDDAVQEGLIDCLRCGACDLVCPSHLPLTAEFALGRQRHSEAQLEQQRADHARARFEARQARLLQREIDAEARRSARRLKSTTALDRIRAQRAEDSA